MAASFPSWDSSRTTKFWNDYEAWEQQVYGIYKRTKRDKHFIHAEKNSMDLGDTIRALNREDRRRVMQSYRNLIGFDEHVNHGNVQWIGEGRDRIARLLTGDARQLRGQSANPLAVLLNNLSIQHDPVNDTFGFSPNLPTSAYAKAMVRDSVENSFGFKPGKRMMVWDTETTGLIREAGIRQISAVNMRSRLMPNGRMTFDVGRGMAHDIHYRTARMQWGYLADRGANTRQMNQVMEHLMGMTPSSYANALPAAGDDYAASVTGFIDDLIKSDYIAGHNVKFDIGQLLNGLTHSAAYHQSPSLQDAVERLRNKVSDPTVIRDTLARSKAVLPNLQPAPELLWAGEKRTHSLENLLLETNLADLIQKDVGGEEAFKSMFKISEGGALHAADIDTRLTAYLAKFLYETDVHGDPVIRAARMGGRGAPETMRRLRSMVLKSSAFTPMTHITDISHIDRDIFNRMVEETRLGASDSVRIMDDRIGVHTHTADQLWDILNGENAPFARFKITPLEQEIIKERASLASLGGTAQDVNPEVFARSLGKWRDFTRSGVRNQGVLNKMQDLFKRGMRPPKEEFDAVRRSMAEAGIPFAGLTQPERWMTHAMAIAGTKQSSLDQFLKGTLEGRVAEISDDLGISRFAAQKGALLAPSGNISLPLSALDEALGAENVGGLRSGFGVSAFETPSGARQVNLIHSLTEQDAGKLSSWLSGHVSDTGVSDTLREMGITDADEVRRIIEALPTSGVDYGVTVGYLNGQAGYHAYEAVASINQGLTADRATLALRASRLEGDLGYDRDVIRLGAFRSTRLGALDDDYASGLQLAARRLDELSGVAERNPGYFAAVSNLVGFKPNKYVQGALAATEVVGRHLPVVGAVAAGLGLGYYLNKRRHEQNIYDEALSPQGIEGQQDYSRYREQLGLPSAPIIRRTSLDSLLTAGVTGNADRRKVGHTTMGHGASKYGYLLGGDYQ